MNEAYENCYLELVSGKTETEPTIYDDVVAEGSTPVVEHTSYETCSRQAVKKMQASAELDDACQRDVVVLRRMLFFMSAVAVVALLTAAAALFLAITAMKGRHNYAYLRSREVPSVRTMLYREYVSLFCARARAERGEYLPVDQRMICSSSTVPSTKISLRDCDDPKIIKSICLGQIETVPRYTVWPANALPFGFSNSQFAD